MQEDVIHHLNLCIGYIYIYIISNKVNEIGLRDRYFDF